MKTANTFKQTAAFARISQMPAGLVHWPDRSKAFDPTESEVLRWLAGQPQVLSYLHQKARDAGAIVYDPTSKTWSGRENLPSADT